MFLGTSVIIINYTIQSLVNRVQSSSEDIYKALAWVTDESLQLHRLAQELAGYGDWENCTGDYPVTEYGQKLGLISIEDPSHPKLIVQNKIVKKALPETANLAPDLPANTSISKRVTWS
jgi:hypothetical protein